MSILTRPIPLLLAGGAVVCSILQLWPIAAACGVAWLATVAIGSMKSQGAALTSSFDQYGLSPEARIAYRPIQKLYEELTELVRSHSNVTVVKVIGQQALEEAAQIVGHAQRLAKIRDDLQRMLRKRSELDVALGRLQSESALATSPESQRSLGAAIEAKRAEISQFAEVERGLRKVDADLLQAQTVMSQIKSQIALAGANASTDSVAEEDLAQIVSRMRSLGTSLEESEQLMQRSQG